MRPSLRPGATPGATASTYGGSSGGPNALTTAATTGGSTSTSTFGYDAAGNMTSRTTPATGSQSLTWTSAGKLAAVTGTKGTTGYIYDAGGSLLLQENPGSTTLYLPGEQLTATTSGTTTTTVTGARIIPLPSGGDVVRTGATASYSFEIPDKHGTSELSLDGTAQVPTWRQFTPYGGARGTTVTWVDNRGFLGKPADPATGLTYIGARAYDPAIAQFISPDPILKPADPHDLNPYDYAADNPVANADPSGLCPVYDLSCPPSTSHHQTTAGEAPPPPPLAGAAVAVRGGRRRASYRRHAAARDAPRPCGGRRPARLARHCIRSAAISIAFSFFTACTSRSTATLHCCKTCPSPGS